MPFDVDHASSWPSRMVSGGQTGVDRAALEWARLRGVAHGGWCPKGRVAVDGVIPAIYPMQETESAGYRQRTKLNVRDSDATLVVNRGELSGGTLLTVQFAQKLGKPHLVVQLDAPDLHTAAQCMARWLSVVQPHTLNVAGPREDKRPGIFAATIELLDAAKAYDANP